MLPFILLIRHQQNPFKDVKRASSGKMVGEWNYFTAYKETS